MTIEDNGSTLFGIRALEAGYYGGIVQSNAIPRQSSAMKDLHFRRNNSSTQDIHAVSKERWSFLQRLDDRQHRRAKRDQKPILSLQLNATMQPIRDTLVTLPMADSPWILGPGRPHDAEVFARDRRENPAITTSVRASTLSWSSYDCTSLVLQEYSDQPNPPLGQQHLHMKPSRSWSMPNFLCLHRNPGSFSCACSEKMFGNWLYHKSRGCAGRSLSSQARLDNGSSGTLDLEQLYERYRSGFSEPDSRSAADLGSARSSVLSYLVTNEISKEKAPIEKALLTTS